MDLVESGVVIFVAFVFIGGTMAYLAGPPPSLDFTSRSGSVDSSEPTGCDAIGGCKTGPQLVPKEEAPERGDDDEDDDERPERESKGKGKGRGKD